MTTGTKIMIGVGGAFVFFILMCCGGYGLFFRSISKDIEAEVKAEEARPHPSRSHYDKIATGMTEAEVEKLLGMPSGLGPSTAPGVVKVWDVKTPADIGTIRVTFREGKAILKSADGPAESSPPTPAATGTTEKPYNQEFWVKNSGRWRVEQPTSNGASFVWEFDIHDGVVGRFVGGAHIPNVSETLVDATEFASPATVTVVDGSNAVIRFDPHTPPPEHIELRLNIVDRKISGTDGEGHRLEGVIKP